jgi:hypothetical protein
MSEKKTVELTVPTSAELMGPADAAYRDAVEVVIDSDDMRDVAVEERNTYKAKWTELEERRKSITQPLMQAKAAVDALFKPALERLDSARQVLDKAILTYNAAQEAKRREEQARLEAAAKAERERAEAEARKAQEEADRLAAQAAQAATAEEAERLEAAAQEAQQNAAAAAVVAETIVAPVALPETKMAGASVRKTTDFEVVDKAAFIKWIAAQLDTAPHLANLLVEDSVRLRAHCRTYGPDPIGKQQIPGIRIYEKGSIASARKAA